MRYEFEKEGRPVGTAQWEGPGQVTFELSDERARPKFDRFFAREEVYLGSGHDGEEFQVRRAVTRGADAEPVLKALEHTHEFGMASPDRQQRVDEGAELPRLDE